MFDVPDAKRVRRTELNSSLSSPEPSELDPALTALLHERLSQVYGPITTPSKSLEYELNSGVPTHRSITDVEPNGSEIQQLGFEFPLFSTTTTTRNEGNRRLTRVILDDDGEGSLASGKGAFIAPHRHPKFYFTSLDPDLTQRRKQYQAIALEGDDVRSFIRVRYTGWEVPWRVTTLQAPHRSSTSTARRKVKNVNSTAGPVPISGNNPIHAPTSASTPASSIPQASYRGTEVIQATVSVQALQSSPVDAPLQPPRRSPSRSRSLTPSLKPGTSTSPPREGRNKTKPNKKRRIALRIGKKLAETEMKREEEKREGLLRREREKVELGREKKMRRNRERKVKRKRLKEKARELGELSGAGGGLGVEGVVVGDN